jgi:hypothetical protein
LSTKEIRSVKVAFLLDVNVERYCRHRNCTPEELTQDVRDQIDEWIRTNSLVEEDVISVKDTPRRGMDY